MNPTHSIDKIPLALHLADRALAPIFSSANSDVCPEVSGSSSPQASALSSLTNTAVTAYDASLRFGTGAPLRIMIETNSSGPILLSSFLNPQFGGKREDLEGSKIIDPKITGIGQSVSHLSSESIENCKTVDGAQPINSNPKITQDSKDNNDEQNNLPPLPPLLIASVVASSSTQVSEARRAITRLVKVGRDCQTAWFKEPIGANLKNTLNNRYDSPE